MPFLENVARGKNVPPQRLQEVARHYEPFGGVSPANAQVRGAVVALVTELNAHGPPLPVYWGNRHWHPLLGDTVRQMADDGVRRALAFVTSAFGSYPGCGQYVKDIAAACQEVGRRGPADRQAAAVLQSSGIYRGDGRSRRDALESLPADPPRRCAAGLHGAQRSRIDDLQLLLPAAASGGRPWCRSGWDTHPGTWRIRVAAGRRGKRGSNPTWPTIPRRLAAGGGSRDVVLAPIGSFARTWRPSTIWTWKLAGCARSWV